MSRTQLQPLQLNSLPRTHEHDEFTARPGGQRNMPSWNTAPNGSSDEPSSPTIDSTPGLPLGLSRPLNQAEQEKLAQLDRLKFFLATAPSRWDTTGPNASSSSTDPYLNMGMGMNGMNGLNVSAQHAPSHPALNRFLLPTQEFVTCVLWNGLYHITGTDIVRALVFRFEAFGRPVRNMKKFEEGVFSDLRNLKPGQDASLEEPKSPFLDLLFKYQCIRTQKKQKVFYWFSVPHDRLFLDALERDLKREKMGLEPTTQVLGEPALSFVYDGAFKRSLYEQFVKAAGGKEGEGELERVVRGLEEGGVNAFNGNVLDPEDNGQTGDADTDASENEAASDTEGSGVSKRKAGGVGAPAANNPNSPFFHMFTLFEGSPTYKQRRKKTSRPSALSSAALASTTSAQHGGMMDPSSGGMEMLPHGMVSNDDVMRGRYDMRTVNGTPGSSVSSLDRYPYPSGEQYATYNSGGAYGHGIRGNMGYHPNSSPPTSTRFPNGLHGTAFGVESGYGQGYGMNGVSDPGVRVKQEPVSAADMFLRQARGELPNAAGPTPAEVRAMKRHSYAGAGLDTSTIPVWLEGKFAGVGMAATSGSQPPFAQRGRSLDDSMNTGESSPYVHDNQHLGAASPYVNAGSISGSPPRSSVGPSPPGSGGSPQSGSGSPPGPSDSHVTSLEKASAAFPNPVTIPATSSTGAPTSIKAYACPLLSCGRLFKRMEHLKRHLRTHTLERPFVCTKDGCGKRFSRSDNLGQHLRVCRGGKSGASPSGSGDAGDEAASSDGVEGLGLSGMEWGVNVGEWINSEIDDDGHSGVPPSTSASSNFAEGSSAENEGEDADMDVSGESRPRQATADIGVGLNMFGGSNGMGMGMGMTTNTSPTAARSNSGDAMAYDAYGSMPSSGAPLDISMELCEVELTGDVREVHGDEEGLVRVHVRGESGDESYLAAETGFTVEPQQNPYAQQSSNQFYENGGYHAPQHHASLDSHLHALQSNSHHLSAPSPRQSLDSQLDAQAQWAMRAPSPAYSTISVPSLSSTSPNRNSWNGGMSGSRPHPSYARHNSNGSSTDSGYDDSAVSYSASSSLPIPGMMPAVSVSAPSHKLAFDHGNLYPHGMLEPSNSSFSASMGGLSVEPSTGGGPVRRHRSMTPNLTRGADGGFVRRPGTSGSASADNMSGITSGYHPYASSSRASSLSRGGGSAHSSPAGHQLPLPGMGMQRSESRASSLSVEFSGSPEHLRQMMSRPNSADPTAASKRFNGEVYRTESPAPFANFASSNSSQVTDSPGTFVMDLPPAPYHSQHQPSHLHSATVPTQFGMSGFDGHLSQGMNGGNAAYYPHHVSTI